MTTPRTIECTFQRQRRALPSHKEPPAGREPEPQAVPPGRVPRVARLLALALRCDRLIQSGTIADYAALAALAHVSRARISQIMNLVLLAPDIQEEILHLPRTESGRDPLTLRLLQPVAAALDWQEQRRLWAEITREMKRRTTVHAPRR